MSSFIRSGETSLWSGIRMTSRAYSIYWFRHNQSGYQICIYTTGKVPFLSRVIFNAGQNVRFLFVSRKNQNWVECSILIYVSELFYNDKWLFH